MADFVHRVRWLSPTDGSGHGECEGEFHVMARTQTDDARPASAIQYKMLLVLKPGETSWDGLVRAARAIVAQEEWIRIKMAGF